MSPLVQPRGGVAVALAVPRRHPARVRGHPALDEPQRRIRGVVELGVAHAAAGRHVLQPAAGHLALVAHGVLVCQSALHYVRHDLEGEAVKGGEGWGGVAADE